MTLAMMNAFVESVEAIPTPPKDADKTSAFLTGVEKIVTVLREMQGLPMGVVEALASALKAARENEETERIPPAIYENLGNMARVVNGALTMARQLGICHQLRAEMANTKTENTPEAKALRVKLRLVR